MILLVDDQADVRFMLSLWLEDEGVEFEEAVSGEQALDELGLRTVDKVEPDRLMEAIRLELTRI